MSPSIGGMYILLCPHLILYHVFIIILVDLDLFVVYVAFNSQGNIVTGSLHMEETSAYCKLYCKLPTNGKQLPAFPLEAMTEIEPWPQRWEARVLPLCHRGP